MNLNIPGIEPAKLKQALDNIGSLPKNEQIELLQLLDALEAKTQLTKRQNTFLDFVNHVYPGYKVGAHHEKLAKIFEEMLKEKRKELLLTLHLDTVSQNLSRIWHRLGSWVSTLTRKLLWLPTQLIWLLTSVAEYVTLWVLTPIKTYFQELNYKPIVKAAQ